MVRSRQRVLAAATTCFLQTGYDATTVDQVAALAEVARGTVFNVCADKESLFRAALGQSLDTAERFTAALADRVRRLVDPGDLDQELTDLAEELAMTVLSGPVVPLRRLLAREGARFPDLLSDYRRRAPEAVLTALAQTFSELAQRGLLRVGDPQLAAEHYAFAVMGADLDRGMLGQGAPTPDRIQRRAAAGAAAFWRAYGPTTSDAIPE